MFVIETGEEHAHKAVLESGERALLLLFEPADEAPAPGAADAASTVAGA